MIFQKTTFTRVFAVGGDGNRAKSGTRFSFESNGKRFYDIPVPGQPKIEEGMTVIALLETPDGFAVNGKGGGIWGWVNCRDGSIACDGAGMNLVRFFIFLNMAIVFPPSWVHAFGTSVAVTLSALLFAVVLGYTSFRCLYLVAQALLVKKALVAIRDIAKPSVVAREPDITKSAVVAREPDTIEVKPRMRSFHLASDEPLNKYEMRSLKFGILFIFGFPIVLVILLQSSAGLFPAFSFMVLGILAAAVFGSITSGKAADARYESIGHDASHHENKNPDGSSD